jgi:hypothetical protein
MITIGGGSNDDGEKGTPFPFSCRVIHAERHIRGTIGSSKGEHRVGSSDKSKYYFRISDGCWLYRLFFAKFNSDDAVVHVVVFEGFS